MSTEFIGAGSTSQREYHGYAAADKDNGSRELKVYCEELLPFLTGKINGRNVESLVESSDGKKKYNSTVKSCNYITCLYRDDSSEGSAFPPDIRRGEQVRIFNIGDTDQWYWAPTNRNNNSRRTERYRRHISDTLENAGDLNDDNTYFIEMETRRDKHILISTSNSDGEKFRYRLLISPAKSTVTLCDDIGNLISIESEKPRVTLRNSSDSILMLDDKNIMGACHGDFNVRADGNIIMAAGKSISTTSGLGGSSSNLTLNPDGTSQIKASSDLNIKVEGSATIAPNGSLNLMSGSNISMSKGH